MSYFKPDTITFEAALADLENGTAKARVEAAEALAEVTETSDRERAARGLAEALRSGPEALRVASARSLGELGQSIGLDALIEATTSEPAALRQVALIALGRLGLREGFAAAEAALAGPPDARFQAARTLVEIDPDQAYPRLTAALESESDAEVIGALALALAEIGNADAVAVLEPHLSSDREETAFEVAYALALLGSPAGAAVLRRSITTPSLAWDAIDGLERCGGPEAIAGLADALGARKLATEIGLRAASALLMLDPDHASASVAREMLVGGLSSWKLHLRALATDELARSGGDWALSALQRLKSRRRGAHLVTEIEEAITAIRERSG